MLRLMTDRNTSILVVGGVRYLTAASVQRALGISRQTLYRWRVDGLIPAGSRFRTGAVVFTEDEFSRIRAFAERVEPARPLGPEGGGAEP